MLRARPARALAGSFLILWAFVLFPVSGAEAAKGVDSLTWVLSDPQVVDAGQTFETGKGVMISGYTVEAAAAPKEDSSVGRGKFRLTLTVFSPSSDMHGQKAGTWYIHGSWTIVDEKAPPAMREARYSPAVIRGTLAAEVPFNPVWEAGDIEADIRLSRFPRSGGWAHGTGTFHGNEKFAGELIVTLTQGPKVR